MIYLDYAATTPMSEEAMEVFIQASKNFYGNANSLHDIGSNAANLLEASREELAKLLHCQKEGIYFTSGGSESNILAITSLISANKHRGNHLITTKCEHSSILHLFQRLEQEGYEVTYLPVNQSGFVDLAALQNAVKDTTILVAIQHANSEIGTIQHINKIGKLLHERNVLFHCDAVQSFGKIPLHLDQEYIDSLSISSHKVYGPKGVGAVYINPRRKWNPQIPGSTHEGGLRPGTINIPGIAAFVTAATAIYDTMERENARLEALRELLIEKLTQLPTAKVVIEGDQRKHLPNIVGIRIIGMEGQLVMLECNRYGIALSTGSACSIGMQEPSSTLKALGRSDMEAKQFIRISLGNATTKADILHTIAIMNNVTESFFNKTRRETIGYEG
ncbi:IscS subfamily cysteine desulfurase [Caldibacillus lycopersici]|uniref:IscS subfamily cysteine desulfurase n=1 Tax=Perspicuibacillus lycopersici TaxID=1325689 RepID=A0AAE3IRZ5_9BACI|nr:IscS subfamily cysteine desulfurase [Perspicuibacillus lycopersici]MCU9612364.1 IscS subfamily cysteine desulfurase [Perspicuibacillus lycopersici]